MKIAVLGAGSLGTVLAAMLSNAGMDIHCIDGYEAHVKALNDNGANVIGNVVLKNIPVKAFTLDSIPHGAYDVVFYLAKGPNNKTYLPAILSHLHDKSVVCILQNGLPDDAVAQYIGWERLIGGFVLYGATLRGPGITEVTSNTNFLEYEIGEYDGSITKRLLEVQKLLSMGGATCKVIKGVKNVRWTKVALNASMSGMSAALGISYEQVLANEKALECAARTKDEVIKVAHAYGVKLLTVAGQDFEEFELKDKDDYKRTAELMRKFYKSYGDTIASMLFDLRLGRKTEIDVINGAVANKGREVGIPTPFNDLIVKLVKEAETNKTVPTIANIEKFNILLESGKQ